MKFWGAFLGNLHLNIICHHEIYKYWRTYFGKRKTFQILDKYTKNSWSRSIFCKAEILKFEICNLYVLYSEIFSLKSFIRLYKKNQALKLLLYICFMCVDKHIRFSQKWPISPMQHFLAAPSEMWPDITLPVLSQDRYNQEIMVYVR